MPLNKAILRQGFEDLIARPPPNSFEFGRRFSEFYTRYARLAAPLPTLTGRPGPLQTYLGTAFHHPGSPLTCITAYITGLTVFWTGVPVPGGSVTTFLGGPVLQAALLTLTPATPQTIAVNTLSSAFDAATRLVQYVIPPAPPAFLV